MVCLISGLHKLFQYTYHQEEECQVNMPKSQPQCLKCSLLQARSYVPEPSEIRASEKKGSEEKTRGLLCSTCLGCLNETSNSSFSAKGRLCTMLYCTKTLK